MAGKKAGRKQESSRPGIGHDAGAGRMPRGHSRCVWLGGSCGVLALGLWHLTDVRAGVLETGDRFLYGWYGGLMVFAVLVLAAVGYLFLVRRDYGLARIFPAAAMGIGLMYMVVLPPLSAPDEVSHYISAYQLSSRLMGRTARAEDERVFIRAQDVFIEDLTGVMDYEAVEDGGKTAVVLGQKLEEGTYRTIKERGLGSTGEDGTVMSYQMPVRTTPLAYVPQAMGIALGRMLGLGGLGLLFLGRLFNLMFFTAMGCLTIRRMPFGREVAAGAALLPMTLHLAASFSYDVMIIALSGYFTAVCLYLAYKAERVRVRDVAALALVMAVMGPCKMVYGVIAGLCLLIPVKKFGGWGRWTASAAGVLGAFAAAMAAVNLGTVSMYTQAEDSYIAWAGETGYTFAELLHRPLHVLKMCYDTLAWKGTQLFEGMIGGSLGNQDPVLNTPTVIILALCTILVVLALKKPGEEVMFSTGNRLWIWFLALLLLGALMFSMLLAWTPRSASMIEGVQGRYLLPFLPAVLLTFRSSRVVRTGSDDRGLLYAVMMMDLYVAVRIFAVVCLRL